MVYLNLQIKETQRLSNKLADATRVMVKKNWTTIYIKAVPTGDKSAVRFYYTDKMVKYIMAKSLEIQAYPKVNI